MSIPPDPGGPGKSASLRKRIGILEIRMSERRQGIGDTLSSINVTVHTRMVSVGALVAAGLFGALLEKRHRIRNWSLLTMLSAVDITIWKLFSLYSSAVASAPDYGAGSYNKTGPGA